jgi:FSR family fosmidomycin resistance protein-like MFS transporter
MTYLLPVLLGLAHGVSDASAGFLVGLIIQQRSPAMNTLILLYNLLAFGFQPLVGMLFDRIGQPKRGAVTGLLLTLTGLLVIPLNLNIAILLIGIGSACLHAGGGSVAITSIPGKASGVGVFAAFGVVGLALGGVSSIYYSANARLMLILLLVILSAVIWYTPQIFDRSHEQARLQPVPYALLIFFVIAVALRSTVWVGVQMEVPRYSSAALWVAVAAGAGKLVGGFAADRFGWRRWMFGAMAGAGILLVFGNQWLPAIMAGALMLQSVTPLSIAAAGQALPKFPALAASLALGAAILAGGLPFFILPGGWFGPGVMVTAMLLSTLCYWIALKHSSFGKSKQSSQ